MALKKECPNRIVITNSLAVFAPGPGAHRPRRLDERVRAAQQKAVAGGAGAAPLEGGLQRGRRPPVHRDHRHEPPVSHPGEYILITYYIAQGHDPHKSHFFVKYCIKSCIGSLFLV